MIMPRFIQTLTWGAVASLACCTACKKASVPEVHQARTSDVDIESMDMMHDQMAEDSKLDRSTSEVDISDVFEGSHTRRHDAPCTLFVDPSGDNSRDGRTREASLQSPTRAVRKARRGDVICLARGRYKPFSITNFRATKEAPLILRTLPGDRGEVLITSGSVRHGVGIRVEHAEHVHLYDVSISAVQEGIALSGCAHCRVEGVSIDAVGQAGIRVRRKSDWKDETRFEGLPSHHIDLIGNTIRDTGNLTARFGEGIYVGTGGKQGDETHDIFIANTHIKGVRAEAIDIKPWTTHIIVRANLITGGSHFFHGAISVGVQAFDAPDAQFLIEGNRIHGYTGTSKDEKVAGICIGHGNGVVRENILWDISGGPGIRTTTTFMNPNARKVLIEKNTVWSTRGEPSITIHDGDERTGVTDGLGEVSLRGNVTHDGALGSRKAVERDFAGSISGAASSEGESPSSGFVFLKEGEGARLWPLRRP